MNKSEKIAELEERIERLEQVVERGAVPDMPNGSDDLDSRDAAVVGELEHGRSYSGVALKRLYKSNTDIRRDKTAKERAKSLVKRDFFRTDGRHYIFRG